MNELQAAAEALKKSNNAMFHIANIALFENLQIFQTRYKHQQYPLSSPHYPGTELVKYYEKKILTGWFWVVSSYYAGGCASNPYSFYPFDGSDLFDKNGQIIPESAFAWDTLPHTDEAIECYDIQSDYCTAAHPHGYPPCIR